MEARDAFRQAARDYRFLLDRGYASKPSLVLVGDRRRLSAEERLILFRGVATTEDSENRRRKLRREARGSVLLLDAYNAAFVLVHYRIGKPCFLSTDGLLRDAGANYGRVPHDELLFRAFGELAAAAVALGFARAEAFLDAPVSRSAEHAAALRSAFAAAGLEAGVFLCPSADGAITSRLAAGGDESLLVASGDSVLADAAPAVCDIARFVLEGSYGSELFDLLALFE